MYAANSFSSRTVSGTSPSTTLYRCSLPERMTATARSMPSSGIGSCCVKFPPNRGVIAASWTRGSDASQNVVQRADECVGMLRSAYGNPDAALESGLVVVPDEDPAAFERELEIAGVPSGDPAQDEIRL